MEFKHKPVMLDEVIENMSIKENGIYVDGTLGGAGHSTEIIKRLNNNGLLVGIDRDKDALKAAGEKLKKYKNKILYHANHDDIDKVLDELNIEEVDGILFDLGVSSYQLDEKGRGFSYMQDGPLDMRMDKEQELTALNVINEYSKSELERIFKDYGEEKYAKKVAEKIVEKRKENKIETTFQLVDIIKESLPKKALSEKQHPAKRVFQAIRIEVNNELGNLKSVVVNSIKKLKKGGRLEIITFHSLEDRIVKKTYEEMEGRCTCPSSFPVCICGYVSYGKIITKKPIVSSKEELEQNPRARSAKLRVFERR